MADLPKTMEFYCGVVEKEVECELTRIRQSRRTSHLGYKCTEMGTNETTCNPCSHYVQGYLVPVPREAIRKDGSTDMKRWADSIDARVEVPLSMILRA